MIDFRIRGLPAENFAHLFALDDADLRTLGARRMQATDSGFPCRVSLTDAQPGDTVVLLNYQHHCTESPFRSCFAIYVREGERTFDDINRVPDQLRRRLLSLRAYDASGMLHAADVIDGRDIETLIERMLADRDVAYIHAHFAKPGCYAALIERRG